jgi:hypothetical protein
MSNKNLILAIFAVFIIVIAVFLMSTRAPSVVDMAGLKNEENELEAFDADLTSFDADQSVLSELDQTLGDAADAGGKVSAAETFDSLSIGQEAGQSDFSQDLTGFTSDDALLPELDQAFGEVLQ